MNEAQIEIRGESASPYVNGFTREKVIEVILKESKGTKCMNGFSCVYRDRNNNKCFVGCFIPDDLYKPAMENNVVNDLLFHFPHLQEFMPVARQFALMFQRIHDNKLKYNHPITREWLNDQLAEFEAKCQK